MSSFSSDIPTLIKHSFPLNFLYELLMSLRRLRITPICPPVPLIFKLYPIALNVYEGERITKYLSYYDD